MSKPLHFVGRSNRDLKRLPERIRQRVGAELKFIQNGNQPSDWRPMKEIGPGVCEIRVRSQKVYRVFYTSTFPEAVYILHVFEKKTRKTSRKDIELG